MPIINRIADFHADLTAWRRELHRHPETAFEEEWTSAFVAEKLESFGLEVHRGIAKTGLVAVLRGQRENGRAIGLREIGRASGRERVCQYVSISVVAV